MHIIDFQWDIDEYVKNEITIEFLNKNPMTLFISIYTNWRR